MNDIINTLITAKRTRLIITALDLLECERIDSAVIPVPDTEPPRYVAIGTAATVARLLEIDQGGCRQCLASPGSLADDARFRQMMHEYTMGDATLEQVAARIEEWAGCRR